MNHFRMLAFFYHKVKWDDAANTRGGSLEVAIQDNLALRPTWNAKHVEADGRKSWLDIATSVSKEIK